MLFGVTRQAYYQNYWAVEESSFEHQLIIDQVLCIRGKHQKMGTRKLYLLLEPFLLEHQIKIGRDALFDLLASHHLLVRRRKRKPITTNSCHWLRKYPNLIKELIPDRPNQLWVSDLTYWRISSGFIYLSLITDAFSHKIVGYRLSETLDAREALDALQTALKNEKPLGLIHHSDRGYQYCWGQYVKVLQDNNILISMTENGDPRENSVAERVNGILKNEYLENYEPRNIEEAQAILNQSIALYNTERPHMSIENYIPELVHSKGIATQKLWKNYYKKRKR